VTSDTHHAEAVLRAYGLADLTRAEQRARAGVLDRMGAFAPSERAELIAAGLLGEARC
jgi:hypothetical protein